MTLHPFHALQALQSGQGGYVAQPDAEAQLQDTGLLTDFPRLPVFSSFKMYTSPTDVFFWEVEPGPVAYRSPHLQGTQDCVSHSFAVGVEDWMLCRFNAWTGPVATEVLYGGSRVQIGKQKLTAPGTCCAWLAHFLLEFGYLTRGVYDEYDLSQYDSRKADRYGRDGIPNLLISQLKKVLSPTADATPIRIGKLKAAESAWDAIGRFWPVPFATKRGFADQCGPDGICDPVGEWNHSMLIRGRCTVRNGRKCLAVQNSIGDYLGIVNRQATLQSGRVVQLPPGVFLIDLEVFDSICKTEDAYVLF